ncbi:MAG: amylo-alpha-1,6-glucosidase [Synergistaceae bacterium]|jgi:predicted glycogen debranching enzyme|nr:amylo-alpha-1,6-glucosidase [Synergistaceae bacterium]
MYLGKADVNTYEKGVEREFLVSNGAGSYGFTTVAGANTRYEHGLLVVRPKGSEMHTVLVSKIEETVYANNKKYQLSTNRYRDLVYPDGYRYIQEYKGTPFPTALFVVHSIFLKKSTFMPQNTTSSCTVIKYELAASPKPITVDVRPLFAHRTADSVSPADDGSVFESSVSSGGSVRIDGRGSSSFVSFTKDLDGVEWSSKPLWFENLIYEKSDVSDKSILDRLWSPGFGTFSLSQGETAYVILSDSPVSYSVDDLQEIEKETSNLFGALARQVSTDNRNSVIQDLVQSSYHLIADSKSSAPAVLSGFPSVEQRARDTFIALPGLTLATGRSGVALGILESWLQRAKSADMVMPSVIDHRGTAEARDVDAGLWFLYAAEKYTAGCGDDFARKHYDDFAAIIEKYLDGNGIPHVTTDKETKLVKITRGEKARDWMFGDVDGEPLVKRNGYLVEVNALWHNALYFMRGVAKSTGDNASADRYHALVSEVKESFARVFWNESKGYLFDWVDPGTGERDEIIRPNAILAVSLPHPALQEEKGRAVFATCWNELYTTYGLRTLDPHHEKFKGRAEGRHDQRKKARLRGMAWPWLLGHFITAFMRYNPGSYEMGWSFIRPFSSHLRRGCLGGAAEYFDGTMPYNPSGDVISAVSQGELLRVISEDLA